MEILAGFADPLFDWIRQLVDNAGVWAYVVLFAIIFAETGLVVAPFLPGDSLLFFAGSLAVASHTSGSVLDLRVLIPLLSLAAICGDSCNYWIGRSIGPKIFKKEDVRFLNKEHLHRTHLFYEKHGGKTVFIARFAPILRTFAPFVAGIGSMNYGRFVTFSITGSLTWVSVCVLAGKAFGNLPVVKDNFELVVLAIVVISLLPAGIAFIKQRRETHQAAKQVAQKTQEASHL